MIELARLLQLDARPLQIRGFVGDDVDGVDDATFVGNAEGHWVGDVDGVVGNSEGKTVGAVGNSEGTIDGSFDGNEEPLGRGVMEGNCDGKGVVGANESDGCTEGASKGATVGTNDVEGCVEGTKSAADCSPPSGKIARVSSRR